MERLALKIDLVNQMLITHDDDLALFSQVSTEGSDE